MDTATNYIEQLESELEAEKHRSRQVYNANQSMFGLPQENNLIEYQLDLREILDRIYHLLKGHQIKEDEQGNVIYAEPKDSNMIIFNDFGVDLLMNIMSFYLNRNTLLSNYDEETINWKVLDFGNELIDLIHNKYEMMFYVPSFEECIEIFIQREKDKLKNKFIVYKEILKIELKEEDVIDIYQIESNYENIQKKIEEVQHDILFEKIKMYPMVVKELVDTVHSSYLRALNGGERESLRTARSVVQTENQSQGLNNVMQSQNKPFKLWNPTTWTR